MLSEQCYMGVCFFPLDPNAPKIFGFSEFLAGLALMVLAWTIGDVRYRFRVQTAPIPLRGFTFTVITAVGVLTLLTDLWRAEQWLVPAGSLLSPASWQALLAGSFLLTFLTWAWFAFIRPPIYGKRNAKQFAQSLYRFILKGSSEELAVIADELSYSSRALVHHATAKRSPYAQDDEQQRKVPKVESYANDLLMLIADKKFCRVIVESSPGTALGIFQEMQDASKCVHVEIFSKNILNEALGNSESFIFHEAGAYESGLIGHHKPLTQAMFSNYKIVEVVGTLLDPDFKSQQNWNAYQWEGYSRVVLMTLRDYVSNHFWSHPFTLYRAKGYIENAASDLYTLNGVVSSAWDKDVLARLRVAVDFISKAAEILDEANVSDNLVWRIRSSHGVAEKTFYDHLAEMILEVASAASFVTSPYWECWVVQHNSVWSKFFNNHKLATHAGKLIKFKARRLLYNEIIGMCDFPNFKGAKMLGLCLNVMGFVHKKGGYGKSSYALHVATLSWVKNNYIALYARNPRLADACLVGNISYDSDNLRLVKTTPAEGLRTEPRYEYLDLAPAQQGA